MADTDCPVCYDKYTAQVRKPVKCPYCDFAACTVCSKKYLTDGLLDAHCMSCRRAWNDEFLDLNFTAAFRKGPYRKHREDVLLDREIAILPTRQPRVESRFKLKEVEAEMKKVHAELAEWERARQQILMRSNTLGRLAARYTAESEGRAPPAWTLNDGEKGPVAERAKFIMKCPDGECRGFLSTAYKCGTCQKWSCPDCLEIKGEDKDAAHTCNPATKETVALIIKESKPCPKCGERISKIDGCDQMWCVDCHTAFSWTTGQQVNGVIHNPHYYEFLRQQGNGVAPRNAGDVPCGGVPYYTAIQNAVSRLDRVTQNEVMGIHRVTAEITDYRIQNYQGHFNVNDNGDLGVKYLMKEIDRDAMKEELGRREAKRNKHLAIRAILEMFVNTSTMMLNNIVSDPPGKKTKEIVRKKRLEYEAKDQEYRQTYREWDTLSRAASVEAEDVKKRTELAEKYMRLKEESLKLHAEFRAAENAKNKMETDEFMPTIEEFRALRKYVNESLLAVARMKKCSVPQIGENWGWIPFAKYVAPKKVSKKKAAAAKDSDDSEEEKDPVPAAPTV